MLKINQKNINTLFARTNRATMNDTLVFIDQNWTDTPFIENSAIKHEPSSPGQPPAIQSGDLRKSIYGTSNKDNVTIYSTEEYSVYLELGTKDIEPRPFFRPAMNRFFKQWCNNCKRILPKIT
jgi:hypothetical protein